MNDMEKRQNHKPEEPEDNQYNLSNTKKIILKNIDNPSFRSRISPLNSGKISEITFEKALDKLLGVELSISKGDKIRLFQQTLEYYSSSINAEKPLWHSTGSYALRKSLEEGLSGGHGKFSGEAIITVKKGDLVQESLSVSNPNSPSAETFQQIFARLSARKNELSNFLKIDSEKLTGKTLPEVFLEELFGTLNKEEIKKMLAKRMKIEIDQIDEDLLNREMGEIAQKTWIHDFNKREHAPIYEEVKKEVLVNISNNKLRQELDYEALHPFPCMVTLESLGKENNLSTISDGVAPTHVPFEDEYWGIFKGEDIREIRVPENQIEKTKGWLKEKGLEHINIVPIEVFEIKRLIQDSI